MADKLTLEVVTPERLLLSEQVDEVIVPGLNGELGILPQHAALVSQLAPAGVLRYRINDRTYSLSVIRGFVEVADNRVSVLADVAERPEDIDIARAQAARERAERRLGQADRVDTDLDRASAALQRAVTRLQVVGHG